MRVLLLALLLVLMPLRVWVGDAMAIDSLAQAAHSVHTAVAPASDCPGHDGPHDAAATIPGQGMAHVAEDCASCSSCQICHSIALAALLPLATGAAAPGATPQATLTRYASAERAPGFKPPIS